MLVVHEILYAMSDNKEDRNCWIIHVATETQGKLLKIIVILVIYVHESTNPVVEGTSM